MEGKGGRRVSLVAAPCAWPALSDFHPAQPCLLSACSPFMILERKTIFSFFLASSKEFTFPTSHLTSLLVSRSPYSSQGNWPPPSLNHSGDPSPPDRGPLGGLSPCCVHVNLQAAECHCWMMYSVTNFPLKRTCLVHDAWKTC